MSTSTITNTVKDPTGAAVGSVKVFARLHPAGAFRNGDGSEVASQATVTSDAVTGVWSLALERNGDITPSGTWWEIEEQIPDTAGGPRSWAINVGTGNATLLASLITPPPVGVSGVLTQAVGDARYQRPPQLATEKVFYVGKGSNASDANDGLTPYTAKATLAGAKTALAGTGGKIVLGYGDFTPAADFVLDAQKMRLEGVGLGSRIIGTNATGAVVTVKASRCSVANLWITNVPANCTGLRVSSSGSTQNVRLDNIFVDSLGANGIAFGIGDDTALDVSEVCLTGCCSVGVSTSRHLSIGNGGTGNVLDISNFGGNSAGHQYGLVINGGAIISHGLNFETSAGADIWYKQAPVGACVVADGRSENAQRLAYATSSAFVEPIHIANYLAEALLDPAGQGVYWGSDAPVCFENVTIRGSLVPQQFWHVEGQGSTADNAAGTPTYTTFINCWADSQRPFMWPRETKKWKRRIIGGGLIADASVQPGNMQGAGTPSEHRVRREYNASGDLVLDASIADVFEINLTGSSSSLNIINPRANQVITIVWIQRGIGGNTYSWPTNLSFGTGGTPTVSTATAVRDTVTAVWTGSYWAELSRAIGVLVPTTMVAVAVTDTFNRTDSHFGLGVADTGQKWQNLMGARGIAGNKAVGLYTEPSLAPSNSGIPLIVDVIETAKIDNWTIQADVTFKTGETCGLILCAVDEFTFLYFFISDTQWRLVAYKADGGTTLDSGSLAHVDGTTYTLKATKVGNVITLFEGASTLRAYTPSVTNIGTYLKMSLMGIAQQSGVLSSFDNFSAA